METDNFSPEIYMDIIINEVVHQKPSCFDTLIKVVDIIATPKVNYLCSSDPALKGRQVENDIMQNIRMRVVKYAERSFFCKDGNINNNPDEFRMWLSAVVRNSVKDYAKIMRRQQFGIIEDDDERFFYYMEDLAGDRYSERLKTAFDIAISADTKIYKTLTWLAVVMFVVAFDITKINATRMIDSKFQNLTLDDMYIVLCRLGERIEWLKFTPEQNEKIKNQLDESYDNGMRYGDVGYGEFFMAKGGRKSISDWVNRMNNYIQKRTNL